jgi:hypothetical protein
MNKKILRRNKQYEVGCRTNSRSKEKYKEQATGNQGLSQSKKMVHWGNVKT